MALTTLMASKCYCAENADLLTALMALAAPMMLMALMVRMALTMLIALGR